VHTAIKIGKDEETMAEEFAHSGACGDGIGENCPNQGDEAAYYDTEKLIWPK